MIPDAASAAVSTPFTKQGVFLPTTSTIKTYQVDLSTLPERPRLIVEAIPDSAHFDMTIELEITGCTVFDENAQCQSNVLSPATPGPQSVEYAIYRCELDVVHPAYVGETCDVKVRAASFGTSEGPATVDIVIRGQTDIPTSTIETEVSSGVQSVSIAPTKDTTIYVPETTSSNGQGFYLWAYNFEQSDQRNALLAFDVPSEVPTGATIVAARLDLTALQAILEPTGLELAAIPRILPTDWFEGLGFAGGDGFSPPLSPTTDAATWTHRRWTLPVPVGPWATPGGDRALPALASTLVDGTSPAIAFSSPALLDHVRALHAGSVAFDGLLLSTQFGGVQLVSDEHPTVSLRPRLVVQYTPAPIPQSIQTGTLSYFSEGQNFRWIYDTNPEDGILFTPVQGRCAITGGGFTQFDMTYQFQGSTSYAGLDCCTWQIGSRTGVTGTGQAIFYVNVDSSDPDYQPSDYDTDGIKNLCDNCPSVPNGPLLGSCTVGPKIGKLCRANQQCGTGGVCSQAQDDADRFAPADACVPEPSWMASLGCGLMGIAAVSKWHPRKRHENRMN